MDYQKFFIDEVPERLKKLKEDSRAEWGVMSAAEMLRHLSIGMKMSLENLNGEITTPEEKLEVYKRFLMSDKAFGQGLAQPGFFGEHQTVKDNSVSIEDLKVELLKGLVDMFCYFSKNTEHTAIHPSFGRLNVEEWQHLHKKHIEHHFRQFGLINL